jgi:PAS domain-containing protein
MLMSSDPKATITRLDAYRRRPAVRPMDRSLDDVLNRAPIGFLYLDHALRCSKINAWLAAAYGVAVDEAVGRPFREFAPTVAAAAAEELNRLLDDGSPVRIILKVERSGEKTYYQHHFAPVPGPDGRVRGIDVFVCNVDGPMRAQEQLRLLDGRARESAKRVSPSRALSGTRTPAA